MNPDGIDRSATGADNALYQELVLEHKRKPRHFGHLVSPSGRARGHNPQCGDDLQVEVQVGDGQLRDIAFSGQGCAICIASASMMSEALVGRDLEAVRQLQQRFRSVITGEMEPEAADLGKLISLGGVRRYPSRIKCALLGWHALMHALADHAGAGGTPASEAGAGAAPADHAGAGATPADRADPGAAPAGLVGAGATDGVESDSGAKRTGTPGAGPTRAA